MKDDNTSYFAHKAWTSVSDIILVTTWNAFSDVYHPHLEHGQDKLEEWWRDTDSIREEQSVSQCGGFGIRTDTYEMEAPPHLTPQWWDPASASHSCVFRRSSNPCTFVRGASVFTVRCSGLAKSSSAGRFEAAELIWRRGPVWVLTKRLEDKCGTFFPQHPRAR